MRRIINSTFVSLDGIINHMEAWHFEYSDDEAEQIATEQILAADAMLMGRHTYEVYASSWGISEGTYADRINSMPKYVVSTTLEKADWANTKVLAGDLVEEVSRLKQEPGGEILTHGFGPVAKTLLAHGLLDELHLWVHPVFAGVGTTADMLFNPGMNVRLNLVGNRPLASGQIILTYQSVQPRDA